MLRLTVRAQNARYLARIAPLSRENAHTPSMSIVLNSGWDSTIQMVLVPCAGVSSGPVIIPRQRLSLRSFPWSPKLLIGENRAYSTIFIYLIMYLSKAVVSRRGVVELSVEC